MVRVSVCRVGDLLAAIERLAPAALAEPWDNVGLPIGDARALVKRAMTCLEITPAVLAEARARKAQAIIAHHPPIFGALKALREEEPAERLVAELVRARIAVIAAHTNLDAAPWGTGIVLAEACGLRPVGPLAPRVLEDGRVGGLGLLADAPRAVTLRGLAGAVRRRMGLVAVRITGEGGRTVRRAAVCSGSGGSFIARAAAQAEVMITGEINHHQAADALARGLAVLEVGHFESEVIIAGPLAGRLKGDPGLAGREIEIFAARSERAPFGYLK